MHHQITTTILEIYTEYMLQKSYYKANYKYYENVSIGPSLLLAELVWGDLVMVWAQWAIWAEISTLLLLYLVRDASWFNLYIPLSVGHPGIIRKYCELLVSNEIVQTILECI